MMTDVNPKESKLASPTIAPQDDFGQPIVYDTEAVDMVTHSLTGDEGEEDSVTVLQGLARYVENVWPGKTAMQVLIEYEESKLASPTIAPVAWPEGWKISRFEEKPFKLIEIHGPSGIAISVSGHDRAPGCVIYRLLDAMLAAPISAPSERSVATGT